MDFIQTANKQADKFGTGKHGFSAGNPSGGIPATYVSPEWCDNIQQEIVNVIEGAGGTINPAQKNQLYQAIQAMISGNAANDYKASVRSATTANITTLAGGAPNTLDGVTLAANDRILVKDQTTSSQNGIYVVTTLGTGANGAWTRATDADGVGELTSGAVVAVEEGATNADSQWMLTADGPITIGTTSLTFTRKEASSAQQDSNFEISVSDNAGARTFTLKKGGWWFRNPTLGSGVWEYVSTAADLTLTLSSGSTLGTINGVQSDVLLRVVNDAGTLRLTAENLSGGMDASESGVISTTAEGGAGGADSPTTIYSGVAVANKSYRLAGLVRSTQAAAGTWATAPSLIQGAGGPALEALAAPGYGQKWQDFSGSRSGGTTYYNTTGKEIEASATWSPTGNIAGYGTVEAVVTQNGVAVTVFRNTTYHNTDTQSDFCPPISIPPGAAYSITPSGAYGSSLRWSEKR